MKKRTNFQRFLLLVGLLCVWAGAWAQNFANIATCGDNEEAPKLRAGYATIALNPGDVNRDASINISDVTDLIDMLLSGSSNAPSSADVNTDGSVNISDVTDLIDMLLNGSATYNYGRGLYDLNEVYKSMRTAGWSTSGNYHQSFGISAHNLAAEVMGDDMIMGAMGSGWFWYDACYSVKNRYTANSWRSYDLWNTYFTGIANANYILEASKSMTATASEKNYIKGQAYAIRAYSYFILAQWFARTYKGHETDPCVPIYDGLVFNGSTGQPRATVAQVYAQIDADIDQAVTLLNGTTQLIPEHIGYAVALGLKARIALVKEDWATAQSSASSAITASGKSILPVADFMGLNDAHAGNVMWGADIPEDQVGVYASFFAHMSTDLSYGQRSPKQITKWLYNKMKTTDTRRAWWDPESGYSSGGYVQKKFDFSNIETWEGDYIYMRVEEMYLIVAEAACCRGLTTTARNNLNNLMAKRDPNYTCNKTGRSLGDLTTDETGSLREEILIQRRLELWGEDGRIYTIRRLRQGFERKTEDGWPAQETSGHTWSDPECYAWVMTIPEAEFDGNPNMDPVADQNPLGDYASTKMHISFAQELTTLTTVMKATSIPLTLTRVKTQGAYSVVIRKTEGDSNFQSSTYSANFADGQSTATVSIPVRDMEIGHDYYCVLELSAMDAASTDPLQGEQITSTRIEVHCVNGNPTGQNISFESETMDLTIESSMVSFPVPLTRAVTTGDYRATVSMVEGEEPYLSLEDDAVIFRDGYSTANVYVWCENLEKGKTYTCKLRLSAADAATTDPDIGGQITTIDITITRSSEDWVTLGNCVYELGMLGESYYMTVQRDGTSNKYRMLNFIYEGHSIVFTIDDSNQVYIESQPCFEYSSYGLCYMIGYANADQSGYAGTYDPETKRATMEVRYYIPGVGAFPTSSDELIMP